MQSGTEWQTLKPLPLSTRACYGGHSQTNISYLCPLMSWIHMTPPAAAIQCSTLIMSAKDYDKNTVSQMSKESQEVLTKAKESIRYIQYDTAWRLRRELSVPPLVGLSLILRTNTQLSAFIFRNNNNPQHSLSSRTPCLAILMSSI